MRTSDPLHEAFLPADGASALSYLPTPETPGFQQASPRLFQVLLALLYHANRFRTSPACTPNSPVFEATWTVNQLAKDCDCTRNTVGVALKKLAEFGWIQIESERSPRGEFKGFSYRHLPVTKRHKVTTASTELSASSPQLARRGNRDSHLTVVGSGDPIKNGVAHPSDCPSVRRRSR